MVGRRSVPLHANKHEGYVATLLTRLRGIPKGALVGEKTHSENLQSLSTLHSLTALQFLNDRQFVTASKFLRDLQVVRALQFLRDLQVLSTLKTNKQTQNKSYLTYKIK